MTAAPDAPAIEIADVTKSYGGLRPLRVQSLVVGPRERVVLSGLDAAAAEVLVNLITGTVLPHAGKVEIFGRSTATIANESDWLAWLDSFGIVSRRAVLLPGSSLAQNLALPFTLELDPIPPDALEAVTDLAAAVGLPESQLNVLAGDASPLMLMLLHLAKALATRPRVLLLEHPTESLDPRAVRAFAGQVRQVAERSSLAVLAISEDDVFGRALGGARLRLEPATGVVRRSGWLGWR